MATTNLSWWQRNRKSVFITLAAITTVLIGVMGFHWEETADTKFWWSFWPIAAITCDLLFIGAWAYFWNKDKHSRV